MLAEYAIIVWSAPFRPHTQVRKIYEGDEMSSIGWCAFGEPFSNYRAAQQVARWLRRIPHSLT